MESAVLKVSGMTCAGCVRSVGNVLKAQPGVASADVSLEKSEARVTFDPAAVSRAALCKAIEEAGYEAQ